MAWALTCEYRNAMSDKIVDILDAMEEYGRRWERQRDLNSRYVPPPTAVKVRVNGDAFDLVPKQKVSAVKQPQARRLLLILSRSRMAKRISRQPS